MNLITKEKFIQTVLNDCKDLIKVVDSLYLPELESVLYHRVINVYNLSFSMTRETQLFLIDLIKSFVYGKSSETRKLREDLMRLLK